MGGRHVLALFLTTVFAFSRGQVQIEVTLLDNRYSHSEDTTNNNYYQCYLSDPDESATVEPLRLGNTRRTEPDMNPPPPDATKMTDASWRVTFDEETDEANGAFGVFGCNANIDGEPSTLVPTIRMRSDADVLPVDGLLTQTVNVGDGDVSITMQIRDNKDPIWRKDTVVQNSFNFNPVYTIKGPVSVGDAGIYECHVDGERNDAKHALRMMIVRACTAYRWDPPSCNQTCDECYNGGVCDENSGKCICPAGFMGTNCETACADSNTFGDDCVLHCSSSLTDVDACSNKLFCRPHPAGCRCITGFEGFNCDQACTEGTFGASCLQTCNCADGVSCDKSTGSCSGNCPSGWKGDTCQDCDGDKYGDDCSGDCHCDGDSCSRMFGWCSGSCFSQWVDMFPPFNCQTGLTDVSFHKVNEGVSMPVNCTALQGPGGDLSSLDLVLSRHETDLDNSSISSGDIFSDDDETRTVDFLVDDVVAPGETLYCQLRSDERKEAVLAINVSVFELPMLTTAPRLLSTFNSTVEIEWDAWNETGETGDGPVIGYVPFHKTEANNTWLAGEPTQNQDFTFTGLVPDTSYLFSVAAVRDGEGGQGPKSPSTDATTLCQLPMKAPVDVQAGMAGDHQELVELTWQLPDIDEIPCSTGAVKVTIYVRVNSSGDSWDVNVPADTPSYTFNNLTIEETYTFKMSLTTSGGESQLTDGENHTVPRLPEYQTKPTVLERSSTSLNVEWDPWNGEIGTPPVVQYVIYYRPDTSLSEWLSKSVGASQQSVTLEGLDVDTGYDISIAAVREGPNGEGSSGPVLEGEKTLCGDPGPNVVPTDVRADYNNAQQDQVNVTWKFQQENIECSTGVDHFTIYYFSKSKNESREIVDDADARWHVISDLEPEVLYAFRVTVSTSGGESEASESSEPGIEPDGPDALVISLSTVIPIVLIILVVGAFLYKRRQSDKSSSQPPAATRASSRKNNAYENPVILPDETDENATKTTMKEAVYANNMRKPSPILIALLEDYVKECNRGQPNTFELQFQLLNDVKQYSSAVGEKEVNQKKNRFRNMVAYDHSRVRLPLLDDVPDSDYYNANYIKNHGGEYAFIASQGPNRASVADFWRVIWQEGVTNIVMLTNLMEKGKDRCIQYWPDSLGTSTHFGNISVHWKSNEQFADYSVRELVIGSGDDKLIVLNWHFETWPDKDTPEHPTALIGMTKRVKAAQCESKGHLTVHCSAGVGRTGTFIALYTLIDVLKSSDNMDVFGFVEKMRECRINMIQTAKQYKFLHDCLLEVHLAGDTHVSAEEFDHFNATEDQDKLRKQIQVLAKLDEESRDKRQPNPDERARCRHPSILPEERKRPFLQCQGKSSTTNYINACFASSYRKRKAFLATQSPLPETVEDFWRMVYDWECPLIVMLNEIDSNTKPCCQYWPSDGITAYGHIQVELKEEREVSYYHYRLFDVSHAHTEKVLQVHHIQLMMWNKDDPEDVGKLVGSMEKLQNDFNMTKPTVVHCEDGAGRTGVFLTVASERERIGTEKKFDVFNRVRQLRESNRNFVSTEEEYYLCHTLLKMDQSETEYGNI